MSYIIKPSHLALFILYLIILGHAIFTLGYIIGNHTSMKSITNTVTLTVGW